jgi:hypothetical protein
MRQMLIFFHGIFLDLLTILYIYILDSIQIQIPSRCRLRSEANNVHSLIVQTINTKTYGIRSLRMAGSKIWNTLTPDIRTTSTKSHFLSKLKTHFSCISYPQKLKSYNFLIFHS